MSSHTRSEPYVQTILVNVLGKDTTDSAKTEAKEVRGDANSVCVNRQSSFIVTTTTTLATNTTTISTTTRSNKKQTYTHIK